MTAPFQMRKQDVFKRRRCPLLIWITGRCHEPTYLVADAIPWCMVPNKQEGIILAYLAVSPPIGAQQSEKSEGCPSPR